jgi:predicted TIM-barrel fold metal-dependent hydrolase
MARMTPRRIDMHHHFLPRAYMKEEQERNAAYKHSSASPERLLSWTPEQAIEMMDEQCIACAIGSVSTPGVWFGDIRAARRLSRDWNECAARAVHDHPGRFGFFAVVAPPDTEGALKEIEYALDTLKADGIGLLSNYDGKALGDPSFMPVFEELNRRKAVVYVHPTAHPCTAGLIPGLTPQGIEFPLDTTRTIASLVLNGVLARCPDIKFIFAHGGGVLPFLAARIAHVGGRMKDFANNNPEGVETMLKRLYCDTASASSGPQLAAMLNFFPPSHILYGSDYPFVRPDHNYHELDAYPLSVAMRTAIERENALALLPRLGGV